MIDREDMLELTRRMTPSRHCFDRAAGAYMDAEGFVDGSFNIHFGKLSPSETARNLKEYPAPGDSKTSGMMIQLLNGMKECALKNDALLYTFYEQIGENLDGPSCLDNGYAICLFHGVYDVPLKAGDKQYLRESEEIYDFLICAISPLVGDYEAGEPVWGFLYPAFSDRSADPDSIDIFNSDPDHDNPIRTLFTS